MGKLVNQRYRVVDIDSIKPHPLNPNRGDVAFIRESIQANDFYGAVIVQASTMFILAGEHRWRAAQAEGMKQIPVIVKDCDDAQALRILLVDNEAARQAEIDDEALEMALRTLGSVTDGLVGSGFNLADLERLEKQREEEEGDEDEQPLPDPGEDDPIEQKYAVVITCTNEREQEEVFNACAEQFGATRLRALSV